LEAGADFHVGIRADVVRAPELLATVQIHGGDPTAHAHLTAARPDDHFVLHDDGRHGDRLTFVDVAHLGAPQFRPGCRVDGDGVSVEQVVDDLAVGEGGAAVHDVATGDADRRL